MAFGAAPEARRHAAGEIVQDKAQTMEEVWTLIGSCSAPGDDPKAWEKVMGRVPPKLRGSARDALSTLDPWEPAAIRGRSTPLVEGAGVKPKALYQPIRVALTGGTVSPGIFESLAALGRADSVARIDAALGRLRLGTA